MNEAGRKIVATVVVLAAGAMLVTAAVKKTRVYDRETEQYGLAAFSRVSDAQMVYNSTFSGIVRRDGKLYFTYDRARLSGKQTCPT